MPASSLTLADFLLVAELGRVLLFSWEELELFSSSSSSSSKLMLLEMPTVSRDHGHRMSKRTGFLVRIQVVTCQCAFRRMTHLRPGAHTAICTHPHIAVCLPTHPDTYRDTHMNWGLSQFSLGCIPTTRF